MTVRFPATLTWSYPMGLSNRTPNAPAQHARVLRVALPSGYLNRELNVFSSQMAQGNRYDALAPQANVLAGISR